MSKKVSKGSSVWVAKKAKHDSVIQINECDQKELKEKGKEKTKKQVKKEDDKKLNPQ